MKGLNTAATIWCSGAVGSLAGGGFLLPAAVGTATVLFVNTGLRPLARGIDARKRVSIDVDTYYRIRVTCLHSHEAVVRTVLLRHIGHHPGMNVQGMSTEELENDRTVVMADVYASQRNDRFLEEIVARISIEPDVKAVSWERGQG